MRENQIYITTDYDKFVFRNGNRDVVQKHIDNIADNMQKNGWVGVPIEISVNNAGEYVIEEGQHRYEAARKTKTPVHFMVGKAKTIYEIGRQNSLVKPWNKQNFIKAYADEGNYSYKRLQNLINEFPNVVVSDILLAVGTEGRKIRGNVEKGYTQVTDEQYYKAREILKYVSSFTESMKAIGINTRSVYMRSIIHLLKHDLIDGERLLDKMDKYGKMLLHPSATKKQAYENIQTLYNYHQQKGIVYFMDKVKAK